MACWFDKERISGTPSNGSSLQQVANACLQDALTRLQENGHRIEDAALTRSSGGPFDILQGEVRLIIEADSPNKNGLTTDVAEILRETIDKPLRALGCTVHRILGSATHIPTTV